MSISRNISILAQGASASGILSETFGGTGFTSKIVRGTSVTLTNQTSVDFTSIPSWVKRITIMFNGVSTNGVSNLQIQIGSAGVTTSGYTSIQSRFAGTAVATTTGTSGFIFTGAVTAAADTQIGQMVIVNVSENIWVSYSGVYSTNYVGQQIQSGNVTLGGVLDRVRLTTVNGTDTFDAGSINILYE